MNDVNDETAGQEPGLYLLLRPEEIFKLRMTGRDPRDFTALTLDLGQGLRAVGKQPDGSVLFQAVFALPPRLLEHFERPRSGILGANGAAVERPLAIFAFPPELRMIVKLDALTEEAKAGMLETVAQQVAAMNVDGHPARDPSNDPRTLPAADDESDGT